MTKRGVSVAYAAHAQATPEGERAALGRALAVVFSAHKEEGKQEAAAEESSRDDSKEIPDDR